MKKNVWLDHDGGIDDLLSLLLLLQMPDIELKGVTVTPADCYLEPAVQARITGCMLSRPLGVPNPCLLMPCRV